MKPPKPYTRRVSLPSTSRIGRPERTVEIRLKLEKQGGGFGFHVDIHNLDRLVAEEFAEMAAELTKATEGVPVWQGAPPEEMGVGV